MVKLVLVLLMPLLILNVLKTLRSVLAVITLPIFSSGASTFRDHFLLTLVMVLFVITLLTKHLLLL